MAVYTWPATVRPQSFQARVQPNTRVFTSPYSPSTQVLDLLGEVWYFSMELRDHTDMVEGAQLEALFDRLAGGVNLVEIPMLHRELPQGTLRDAAESVNVVNGSLAPVTVVNASLAAVSVVGGTPALEVAVDQQAGTATLIARIGKTLRAGDHIRLPNGQVCRQMVDTVADSTGRMPLEFRPRARQTIAGATVVGVQDTRVKYRLTSDSIPMVFRNGRYDGPPLEGVEVP
jgi:hypothetical protein